MFHNILVAVDGSAGRRAGAGAGDRPRRERAHPADTDHGAWRSYRRPCTCWPAERAGQLVEDAHLQAEAILRQARDRVPDDLPVTTVLERPADPDAR